MSKTFEEYLAILDHEITKRNNLEKYELLQILEKAVYDRKKSTEFNAKRRSTWFRLIQKRLHEFTCEELMELWRQLKEGEIQADTYNPAFFAAWESALVNSLEAKYLLKVLEIYRELELEMPVQLLKKWCFLGKNEVTNWSSAQLAYVIESFAEFRLRPDDLFIQEWARVVVKHIHEFQPNSVADFVYGIGKLWITDAILEEAIIKLIRDHDQNQLKQMTAQSLIRTADGIAELKIDPKPINDQFAPMWIHKVSANLSRLSSRDTARAGWVLHRLNIMPDQEFVNTWRSETLSKHCIVAELEDHFRLEKMSTYIARDLHLTLRSAVHMQMKNDYELTDRWMQLSEKKLKEFYPQALASTLLDLHYLKTTITKKFLEAWARATREKLTDMYATDLVTVMIGLAMIKEHPKRLDTTFMDEWYITMRGKVNRLGLQSIDDLDQAFADLKIEMTSELHDALERVRQNKHKENKKK